MPFFAILDKDQVVQCATEPEARAVCDGHLAKGHPAVRSASVYEGPDEGTVRRVVVEGRQILRFCYAGIPPNFYASDEWRDQQERVRRHRLERGGWDCHCGEENDEDTSYCPSCGREIPFEAAERGDA